MWQLVLFQVTIGVTEENTSTVAGVSNIMRYLHQYVPCLGDDLYTIPCHGDGMSVERMRGSLRHNSGGITARDRLEGIIPVPQEFHKRMLLLEVIISIFELAVFCTIFCNFVRLFFISSFAGYDETFL